MTTAGLRERDWSLYADWCEATGRDAAAPLSLERLQCFLGDVCGAPATQRRRLRSIRHEADNRGIAVEPPSVRVDRCWREGPAWLPLSEAVMRCETSGWPHGLRGRRDAWLLVLAHAGFTRGRIRSLTGPDVQWGRTDTDEQFVEVDGIRFHPTPDPATCQVCVISRWVAVMATDHRFSWRTVRESLIRADTLAADDPDRHACDGDQPSLGPGVATLLPSVNKYGHIDVAEPLHRRSITAVIAARLDRSAPRSVPLRAGQTDRGDRPAHETAGLSDDDLLDLLDERLDAYAEQAAALADLVASTETALDPIRAATGITGPEPDADAC